LSRRETLLVFGDSALKDPKVGGSNPLRHAIPFPPVAAGRSTAFYPLSEKPLDGWEAAAHIEGILKKGGK